MNYRVFLAADVVEFIDGVADIERKGFALFLKRLADQPAGPGDYCETAPDGRSIEIIIYGDYAVMYYYDHAVKELKVVDIHSADK